MEPTHGDYDITAVDGFDALSAWLRDYSDAPTVADKAEVLSELLMNGHEGVGGYLTFGNNKVAKNTGIFNMNSATDCPNADSDENNQTETGVCQVPWSACYAHKAENIYPDALKKRRLQEFLWDNVSAEVFAKALLRVKDRKRSAFDYLRVSESGDFRNNDDIKKWDKIAGYLGDEIRVYTYSASHKLSAWGVVSDFTVNQSNDLADYGDREFTATFTDENGETQPITEPAEVPDDHILCPFEAAKVNGVKTDKRPKCGDCTACIEPEEKQPKDVAIIQH